MVQLAQVKEIKAKANKLAKDSAVRDNQKSSDTVRLWESYREQALLWRVLALFQVPATIIALGFAVVMYNGRVINLNVPAKPLPGFYNAKEIPDAEFIGAATEFINLIASYQPHTARTQFDYAARWLIGPMLARFEKEMIGRELSAVETTRRSQLYFIDPTKTVLERLDEGVAVTFTGERQKLVAGELLPTVATQYRILMFTAPRSVMNPYGIVITNVEAHSN